MDNASVMNTLAKYLEDFDLAVERRWIDLGVLAFDRAKFFVDWPIWSMRKFLSEVAAGYDLVHTTAWRGAIATYLECLPYTIYLQGSDIRSEYWRDPVRRRLYRNILLSSRGVAVSTPDLIEYVERTNLGLQAPWIPNPLDPLFLQTPPKDEVESLRERLLGEGDLLVFSPTRIDGGKGIDKIFKAMRLVMEEYDVTYVQVRWIKGKGAELMKLAPENTVFIPPIARKDIPLYYAASDVVIGQMGVGMYGMTEIEASSMGKPVTVYVKPEHFDEEVPFIPKEGTTDALTEALRALITDEGFRKEYGARLRSYVMERHHPDVVSDRMRQFWIRSLETEPRRRCSPRKWEVILPYLHDIAKLLASRLRR